MQNLSSDQTGQFIYLIVLLFFISSGFLFKGKIKASQALTQLFCWLLITLTIIVLYSFRYDFYNIKDRLISELFPSHAVRLSDSQVSINISRNNHFYIKLKVNNQNIRFMIDTGASDMVINQKDAKKVGLNLEDLVYNKRYQTANGSTFGASVTLQKIEFGGLIFNNVPASVNNSNMGTSLLGMSFLRNFKKYEFYQDRLILTY
jgi:aspartyl protease family protein